MSEDLRPLLVELIERFDSRLNAIEKAVERIRDDLGHYDKAKIRLANYNRQARKGGKIGEGTQKGR